MSAARRAGADGPPAVVLGGMVTGLSVARGLADAGIHVSVLDTGRSPARWSRLLTAFVEIDRERMQAQMLDWLRDDPSGAVVLACNDDGVEMIARHRAELVDLGYRPMEADDEVLLAMLDKERTRALAVAHDIPVARTWPLRGRADVDTVSREIAFPCVLKPVSSHEFARRANTGAKVLTAADPAQLKECFERMSAIGVQLSVIEVIAGPDDEYVSYYSYLDERGEPLLEFTKRKIRQHPPQFGIGTYHATTHDSEVAALGLRFFQAVGLRGLGNVEFKRDGADGRLKLIECNPRFTMSNEVIRRAGVDLGLFSYNRLTGRPTPPVTPYRDDLRLWDPINDTRAFIAYRRRGELSTVRWLGSLAHPQRFPVARLDDPLPAAMRASQMMRRAARSRQISPGRSRLAALPVPLLEPLTERGRRGRALGARLDLVAATGLGYSWRRLRAEERLSGLGEAARNELYDRIWREAAEAIGGRFERLAPGLAELARDGVATRIFQQVVDLDDPVTLRVALDKALVHRLLGRAGVPTAEHLEFDVGRPEAARAFLAETAGACVVKPAAGTGGGHGTTAGIRRPAELRRACLHAATGGDRVLIERQAMGDVYRLLLLDGELLDVVRSRPPHLTGDGRATIEELIAAENRRRIADRGAGGLSLLGVNLDMVMTLERAHLSLSSVLPAGREVAMRTITNNNSARDNETFRGALDPDVVAAARTAASEVGLRLAGVDVITTDPGRALAATQGIVAEVNGTPGLHHHYLVADPAGATAVAIPVLETLLGGPGSAARG